MPQRILVIPEYNEERTILGVLEHAYPYVDEIVVVDDGSTDHSAHLVQRWADGRSGVTLLTLRENQGMSGALLTGFAHVVKRFRQGEFDPADVIINIDADGQHDPNEIPGAVATLLASNLDVLLGRRDLSGYPLVKRVGNWGLSLWASLLTGYRYHDVECGFRLMRVPVAEDLLKYFTGRRYGCAQEIGVITALRRWKVDNRFPNRILYYRHGARIRDGVTNLTMGLLAFLRVVLGIRHAVDERVAEVLSHVIWPPPSGREEPPCVVSS